LTKASTDKTFVGSVTAYYDKDSLVLINTLTDAEAGGTETLYFLSEGVLMKVFIMSTTFDSSDEWTKYASRHKSVDQCCTCHGERNCIVTEVTFGNKPTIEKTENKNKRELTQSEKEKLLSELQRISEELEILSERLD
jgi:hypothetical protein